MPPTPPPRTLLLLLAVGWLAPVAPAEAADPRPRLPVPVEDVRASAPGLAPFLDRLAAAVRDRDAAFVRAHVDPGFACYRDFGGLCDWERGTGLENFGRVIDLGDGDPGPDEAWGWRRLGALAGARTVGPIAADDRLNGEAAGQGLVCGPAPPDPAALEAVERFAGEDYWFQWAFIEGAGVRLRAGPSVDAGVVELLSFEAVALGARDVASGPGAPEGWVSVVGSGGREGWIAGRFVRSFVAPRLCYGRGDDGGWRIKAHIGGGD